MKNNFCKYKEIVSRHSGKRWQGAFWMVTERIERKSVLIPDWIGIKTEREYITGAYHADGSYGRQMQLEIEAGGKQTDVFFSAGEEAVEWMIFRWNESFPRGSRFLGDAWERGYGELEWRGLNANRPMPWYFMAWHANALSCRGVMTNPSAMCFWEVDAEGVTLYLDVRCGGEGVRLNGRRLHVASIIAREYSNCSAFEGAKAFCSEMCPSPIFPEKPIYGGNNWYYAYGKTSHEEFLRDTDFLIKLTEGCRNPPCMVLDDGWQFAQEPDGYNGGPWHTGNQRFPDMARLAEEVAERGAQPGIWIRPLKDDVSAFPLEWRLPHTKCLDPSHPEALHHIVSDMQTLCAWGYRLIKYDFVTYDLFGRWGFEMNPSVTENGWHFYDRSMTSAEVVKRLYRAIYEAVKPFHAILIGCNAIGHLGAGYFHINRVGDDVSGLEWERTRKMGINSLAFRLCQHNTFYHADADCVGITENIPWELNRQWADLIARSGTPLFVSVNRQVLNEAQRKELAAILECACEQKHHARPVDWIDHNCPREWQDGGTLLRYQWHTPFCPNFLRPAEWKIQKLPGD